MIRRPRSVAVVGAGLAGLSAAMHLAGAGATVDLFEASEVVGGCAARPGGADETGYLLEAGPTVLTETAQLDRCFAALGERRRDWVELLPVDPSYEARFADGSVLPLWHDRAALREAVVRLAGPGEGEALDGYLRHVQALYDLVMPAFIDHQMHRIGPAMLPDAARLARLGGFGSLQQLVRRHFRDPRLQQAFSFQSLYVGMSPARARGVFAVIAAMDLLHGVTFPAGGMSRIPDAMAAACRAHGVRIHVREPVTRLRAGHGVQVSTDRRRAEVDAVVAAVDPVTARALAGDPAPDRRRRSPSCVLLVAGTREPVAARAHHTICFGSRVDAAHLDLAAGRPMREPSFLVSVPTRTDPSLAPPGGDVVYALFPVPNLSSGLDWRRLRPVYRRHVLRNLQRQGLAAPTQVEVLLTPQDWQRRGHVAGTPFSRAHTAWQTGPLRSTRPVAPGVVLAGAGTHPGVGVPMALISGRLAAERVLAGAA